MAVPLVAGSEIGPYRIEREIGRGGMGHVFVGEHRSLGRKAALKVLLPSLVTEAGFRERFVRESQLIAAIEHPNMIPIYDAGDADGVLFIAMRYVDGHDLQTLIDRDEPLSTELALEIVGQAAAALDAAHAREIVHRDVKPANILIDEPSGRTFLTDFGIAKQGRTEETREGTFVGTVDYASPEQIQGHALGSATDVYALGGVLYAALTGEPPFPKDTDLAVVYAHLLDPPPAVTAKRPELPPAFDDVVARALAKEPAERYGSCGELIAAARDALSGGRTAFRAAPSAPPPAEGAPRRLGAGLPEPDTALVGRGEEVAASVEQLQRDDVRLLTLTGAGGSGKTRVALEVAATLAPDYPAGVHFAALGTINDPSLVLSAVAAALGVEEQGTDLVDAMRVQLGNDSVLVVLDSFEHVLPAAGAIVELLVAAPRLDVLITSRSLLRVRGEREVVIAPFPLPAADGAVDARVLGAFPAVQLFVARAADVRPGFELNEENAAAIGEICRRLDGLPLAIELAAARMKLLSPQAVAGRLENRLQLLVGGARDLPSRHQTLRGTIDWSFDLLPEDGKTLFARAAVFVDGFTLAAAEAVCGFGDLDGMLIVDALEMLADGNLVHRRDGVDGEPRFEMLETVREYALFRLIERGELEELRRRHALHSVELAELAEPELVRAEQTSWARRLDEDAGNVRAALTWALEGGDLESGLRIASALFRFWSIRGQLTEARKWLHQGLVQAEGVAPAIAAKAAFAAGYSALGQGDLVEAISRFEESLAGYRELHDDARSATALVQLGWLVTVRGDMDAGASMSQEGLDLARALGDVRTASVALSNLGDIAVAQADFDRAEQLYAETLALRREIGDTRIVADALLKSGRAEALRGRTDRALTLLQEGRTMAEELGDGWTSSVARVSLAFVALEQGSADEADPLLLEALRTARERGDIRLAAESLGGLAAVAAMRGQPGRAATLWGAAEGFHQAAGAAASSLERALLAHHGAGVAGESTYERERAAGRGLDLEGAFAAATSHTECPGT
jgi:predicted ATPase/TolA-binding protein/predicted Ser/Thr protein kinase